MAKKTKKYVCIRSNRYLYEKPDCGSERVAKPGKGDECEYLTKKTVSERVWFRVKFGDKIGWIKNTGLIVIEK